MSVNKNSEGSTALKNASLDQILDTAKIVLQQNGVAHSSLGIRDVSGNSGSKTYLCSAGEVPKCIVKVSSGNSIMNSHPLTIRRVNDATEALRKNNIAPALSLIHISEPTRPY